MCDVYALIPVENYTIPTEAEGPPVYGPERPPQLQPASQPASKEKEKPKPEEGDATTTTVSTGDTTRRHRHTPSTGSAVTVIHEDEEDDPGSQPTALEQPASDLRDPLADNNGETKEPANEVTLANAIEDFTISEPVQEKGEDGKETEKGTESAVSEAEKDDGETNEK